MTVKYRKIVNNRKNSPTKGKVYGKAVYSGIVYINDLCEEIQEMCTLTDVDVLATLKALVNVMAKHLKAGDKVVLDNFGSFKVGLSTSPADTAEKFTAANVKSMRILFAPVTEMIGGKRIKTLLKNVKVEEMSKYNGLVTDADGDNIDKPSSGGSGSKDNPDTGGTGGSSSGGSSQGGSSQGGSGSNSGDNLDSMD